VEGKQNTQLTCLRLAVHQLGWMMKMMKLTSFNCFSMHFRLFSAVGLLLEM